MLRGLAGSWPSALAGPGGGCATTAARAAWGPVMVAGGGGSGVPSLDLFRGGPRVLLA